MPLAKRQAAKQLKKAMGSKNTLGKPLKSKARKKVPKDRRVRSFAELHIANRVVKNVIDALATGTGTRHHKLDFVDCTTYSSTITLGDGYIGGYCSCGHCTLQAA